MRAVFALDARLAGVLRTTRDPMVGQMRLTWWHEALTRLDGAPPPAEPVLRDLATEALPRGASGTALAGLVEGWEELLEPGPLPDDAMLRHADARGGGLFALAGRVLGAGTGDPLATAGRGWALADLARHLSDRATAQRARALAAAPLGEAAAVRWSRAARSLGALAHLARMDLAVPLDEPVPVGSPGRVGRLAWHRLTGR